MNHSGMETDLILVSPLEMFTLRENHSGMETDYLYPSFGNSSSCCVRTIVVWKHFHVEVAGQVFL